VEHRGSGFLVNLDHEQRVRYYLWWRRYLLLKRLAWIAGAAFVLCWILVLAKTPVGAVAAALVKPAFFSGIAIAIWISLLDCPRCGQTFRGWGTEKYYGDECQNCGLTGIELSSIAKPRD
jgi:hypothetical protein